MIVYREIKKKNPNISDEEIKTKLFAILPVDYSDRFLKYPTILTFIFGLLAIYVINKTTLYEIISNFFLHHYKMGKYCRKHTWVVTIYSYDKLLSICVFYVNGFGLLWKKNC